MKVSVVTPNYNGEEFLKNYFSSLNEDSECIGEVIIIDNGSSDSSLDYIKGSTFNFPVVVIENDENLGFAPAVNQGILKARYDYIFSLNNDTEIQKGSIKAMLELISDEEVFSVQAKMLQAADRNLIDDAGDEYNILGWTKKTGENLPSKHYSHVTEIFSSSAGAALYKKELLNKLGLFDDNYFAYMEDVDLGIRAQINGYKNLLCPDAVVYHLGSATSGSRYNEFKVKLAARNNVWTVYKNLPVLMILINFIFLFFGFLIKYVFFFIKGYGPYYLEGIREGLNEESKLEKVEFRKSNLRNYFKLEYKLIINTFKYIIK